MNLHGSSFEESWFTRLQSLQQVHLAPEEAQAWCDGSLVRMLSEVAVLNCSVS